MADRGLRQGANRTLAYTRKLLAWCAERGMIEANPAAGIKPPAKEVSRDRVLEDGEIAAVWTACGSLGFPFGPLIRLMLVTAQREGECAGMRWCDVDLEQRDLDAAARGDQGRPGAHGAPERARPGDAGRRPRLHTGDDAMIFSTTGDDQAERMGPGQGTARQAVRCDRLAVP